MFGQVHASPQREQRLLEWGARAGDEAERRPTGGRRRSLEQLDGSGCEVEDLGTLDVPGVLYLGSSASPFFGAGS